MAAQLSSCSQRVRMLEAGCWLARTGEKAIPRGPAIGLQRTVAARTEQRRGIDARRVEASAILRVGQKVEDDERRVGVDAVDPRSGEWPVNLDVVVADRGRSAEVVTRAPEVGRPLVGERVVGVEGCQVGPNGLRRIAWIGAQPQFQRDVDRQVFPDEADSRSERSAADRPLAKPHDEVGGVGVALSRRAAAAEHASLPAYPLARAARHRPEIGVPEQVRRDPVPTPDDRNRQDRGRGLDLQRRIFGLGVVVAAKEAHYRRSVAGDGGLMNATDRRSSRLRGEVARTPDEGRAGRLSRPISSRISPTPSRPAISDRGDRPRRRSARWRTRARSSRGFGTVTIPPWA